MPYSCFSSKDPLYTVMPLILFWVVKYVLSVFEVTHCWTHVCVFGDIDGYAVSIDIWFNLDTLATASTVQIPTFCSDLVVVSDGSKIFFFMSFVLK